MNDVMVGDYQLLDCGDGRRLERFAGVLVDRPAPQALWAKYLPDEAWQQADVYFYRPEQGRGEWRIRRAIPHPWRLHVDDWVMELKLSEHNQLGVFPEQLNNWRWLRDQVVQAQRPLQILNGFAYTGAATLAASSGGAHATLCHVDGAKASVTWARHNAVLSGLVEYPIRWIVDDVMTYLKREIKRGKRYDGFIFDPPAFGRGPGGTWQISRDLPLLLDCVNQLLSDAPCFVVLSCHVPEWQSDQLARWLEQLDAFKGCRAAAVDLVIPASQGNDLPSSICGRISQAR